MIELLVWWQLAARIASNAIQLVCEERGSTASERAHALRYAHSCIICNFCFGLFLFRSSSFGSGAYVCCRFPTFVDIQFLCSVERYTLYAATIFRHSIGMLSSSRSTHADFVLLKCGCQSSNTQSMHTHTKIALAFFFYLTRLNNYAEFNLLTIRRYKILV